MEVVPVVDEGLGNSSYVVGLGGGAALVVDAFRDPAPYLRIAEQRGWRIRFAAETHLHADFVSGSRELAAATGAEVLASAGAPVGFEARLLADAEEVDLGGLVLRALATPGHTPEHLAFLVVDGANLLGLFSGGTLIAGGTARPDLLGPELTLPLARAAYRSLRERILTLPDDLAVYPTHGAGSFCSAGSGGERTTTIGAERDARLLQAPDEDAFVEELLSGLGSYPPYFRELRDVNRSGPRVYQRAPLLPRLEVGDVDRLLDGGAELIDVRPVEDFAAGHVPGSLSIALRDQFSTWLGWLVDRERPLLFVAGSNTDRARLAWACLGIGYERIAGEVAGGVDGWTAAGRPLEQIPLLTAQDAGPGRTVLDVRQRSEWEAGHVSGATHIELGALQDAAPRVDGGEVLTYCAAGERAMTAASLLARLGVSEAAAFRGKPEELAPAVGEELVTAS